MFDHIAYYESVESLRTQIPTGRYLFLVAEKTDISSLSTLHTIEFIGAIFPRVLYNTNAYETGIIAARMSDDTAYQVIAMENLTRLHISDDMNAVITFIDGYSIHTDRFLEILYSQLPESTYIIGAGAGKTNTEISSPVLFDQEQLYTNYAIVLSSSKSIGLGVKHGWKTVMGPFIATHCSGHILEKINFKNAFDVYRSAIEKMSPLRFKETSFFSIAQHFPLGIVRYNKDFIIREPLSTNGKDLILNAQIDPNSVVSILEAKQEDIIEAAHEAAEISWKKYPSSLAVSSVLVMDCISRYCLLGENFKDELRAIASVYDEKTPLWGALSLSEIANANQEGIELYNNTCVVGTL